MSCSFCAGGTADTDFNPATTCAQCEAGTYAGCGSTNCTPCDAGMIDHDSDPATPCVSSSESECMSTQECAAGFVDHDCDSGTVCVECPPGTYSGGGSGTNNTGCRLCEIRTVDQDSDPSTACLPCKLDGSQECNEEGLTHVKARAGYYIHSTNFADAEQVTVCEPATACMGGIGPSSCNTGFIGRRCASCADRFYRGQQSNQQDTHGQCYACPTANVPLWAVFLIFFIVCIIAGAIFDHLLKRIQRLSECAAPFFVIVTFVQTLDLLVAGIPLEWPSAVSTVAAGFSVFNLNLELARPECSISFNFATKQTIMLLLPVVVLLYVVAMSLVLLLKAIIAHKQARKARQREEATTRHIARQRWQRAVRPLLFWGMTQPELKCLLTTRGSSLPHTLRAKLNQLKWKAVQVLTTAMTLLSIVFLQTCVQGLDCTTNIDGRRYMDVEPRTECTMSDPYYASIFYKSLIGLLVWMVLAALMTTAVLMGGPVKFSFLAGKMKPGLHWWELKLLARKLIIMSVSLSMTTEPLYALFWCSIVILISLLLHMHCRPYKEVLLNTCEDLSLLSTMILLAAGVVFKNVGACRAVLGGLSNSINTSIVNVTSSSSSDSAEELWGQLRLAGLCTSSGKADGSTGSFTDVLIWFSIALMLGVPVICLYTAVRLICIDKIFLKNRVRPLEQATVEDAPVDAPEHAGTETIADMDLRTQNEALTRQLAASTHTVLEGQSTMNSLRERATEVQQMYSDLQQKYTELQEQMHAVERTGERREHVMYSEQSRRPQAVNLVTAATTSTEDDRHALVESAAPPTSSDSDVETTVSDFMRQEVQSIKTDRHDRVRDQTDNVQQEEVRCLHR